MIVASFDIAKAKDSDGNTITVVPEFESSFVRYVKVYRSTRHRLNLFVGIPRHLNALSHRGSYDSQCSLIIMSFRPVLGRLYFGHGYGLDSHLNYS